MNRLVCPVCGDEFNPTRANQVYCSEACYYDAKNERSKKRHAVTRGDLHKSKVLANDLICTNLLPGDAEVQFASFEQLDRLDFDFKYYSTIVEDDLGFAIVLQQVQLRIINASAIQIQKNDRELQSIPASRQQLSQ